MPSYKVKCAMCGTNFLAKTRNEKYCSPLCRADGAKQTRRIREQRASYKKKRNERVQKNRQEEKHALQERKNVRRNQTLSIAQKEAADKKRKYAEEIQAKAEQGDLNALQTLALERGDTLEYWRLYKERILLSEKKFNTTGVHLVGGVDIHEDNFEYLVADQLKQKEGRKQ